MSFWPNPQTACIRIRGIALFFLAVTAFACSPPPQDRPGETGPKLPVIVQDGIPIPHQKTALDQLNYARSGLADKKVKLAAYRAVSFLFPKERLECGHAALGLAYLHLEPEYRFASALEIRQAENDFKAVRNDFADIPEIQAKALWYLGWIHTTLLKDPEKGTPYFWEIVTTYPQVPMNLSPTAPWITLVFPRDQEQKQLKPSVPQKYWSQVALLEIVRHSQDAEEILKGFDILADRHFTSPAAGLAIVHLLSDPALAAAALPHVNAYVSGNPGNPYLLRDIRNLAKGGRP